MQWYRFFRPHGAMVIPDKFTAAYLERFRFAARTIIDVGVADGTPELYAAFPKARLVLIDPLEETSRLVARRHRLDPDSTTFVTTAVGAETSEATLRVSSGAFSKSTFHATTKVYGSDEFVDRVVPVRRLDDVVDELDDLPRPFGIKIDTEGHEVSVIEGADKTLAEAEFVIAEASVKTRFEDGYRFSDLVVALADRGFELIDVLGLTPGSALFLDCLFVRSDSTLFASRST